MILEDFLTLAVTSQYPRFGFFFSSFGYQHFGIKNVSENARKMRNLKKKIDITLCVG